MPLHVIVLLYPHGAQERGCTACVWSVLLSGWSGCRAVSAAVRPLCAVGLSGSCQAVTLGPDSDGAPLMSDSAVRLSDTCCQAVRESAVRGLSTVWNALAGCRPKMSASKGLVLAPFLYAWVSEDECAPDLRGLQSRPRPTAIPPALECRSATRFTPRLRAASRSGDDARPPPTPP